MGLEPGRLPGRLDTLQGGGEFIGGAGDQVPGRAAGGGGLAGQPGLGRVAFHHPVPAVPVAADGLDQVEPGIHRLEQRPVALFAGRQ